MRFNQITDDVGTSMYSEAQPGRRECDRFSPEGLNHRKRILIVDDEDLIIEIGLADDPSQSTR